ncbi:G-protein coupled receptor 4-like [Solea solea]|uniref:G-protein coupled receptor 4-like n=1 Tax=Solea solea TaxID=90069 RepID=UPI00272BED2D|nr:G-protein coupled receptor 4-like [Solea solea]
MSNTTLSLNSTAYDGPPLWYEYPVCAVAPHGFTFYYVGKMFNLAVGTPCNILVIWQIAAKKTDASTCDIFFMNLAFLDTYFCLTGPIDMVNRLVWVSDRVWNFVRFSYGIKDFAPLFLVCICLDRYMAVVHPVLFASVRDNKIRNIISVVVWALILAYALAKGTLGCPSVIKVFSGVILFSFAVMLFCNISVIWVLRRSVAGKEEMHPVKKRAFKMVLIVLAIVVSNYLPPVALMPFASLFTFMEFNCLVTTTVFCIMDLSSSIEPLIYITKMERMEGRCCGRSLST